MSYVSLFDNIRHSAARGAVGDSLKSVVDVIRAEDANAHTADQQVAGVGMSRVGRAETLALGKYYLYLFTFLPTYLSI
jgi:hypothetical protein